MLHLLHEPVPPRAPKPLPPARKLARRYAGANEPFDDLMQVASLGLIKAIDRFNPARGYAFLSFAVPTIVGELKRCFRDPGWSLHVERGAQELALKVKEGQERLLNRTGRAASLTELRQALTPKFFADRTEREIAEQIGISQMQVSRILRRAVTEIGEASGETRMIAP